MVNSFLIFVAYAALRICVIFNGVIMVRICGNGLVCAAIMSPSVSALRPEDLSHWFVAFISASASFIRAGYLP